ncbi:hypothetical protein [Streptomyces sp. 1222.5]|uniref:hypothetical protein n=1 Tax=Streptomyces sp. 1222.5 TaxID=1881026 RepID=UPI003D73F6FF
MAVYVCSLKRTTPQPVPADGAYHVVRFPFGAAEPSDSWNMHQATQTDGAQVAAWATDDRAGLIWPAREGWGQLYGMVQWESGGYTELRDQFVRDPLGYTDDPVNTTATDHRPPSPGMQCFTKGHGIWVYPGTPIALRVAHNDREARDLVCAEFKLAIHT